jgi:hypothetical protein
MHGNRKYLKWVFAFTACSFQAISGVSLGMHPEGDESGVCSGYIYVEGRTNINHFVFTNRLSLLNLYDTSFIEIPVPITEFKTRNPVMHREFLELLNANKYPFIQIGIKYPSLERIYVERENTAPRFEITLAGVTNDYSIPCRVMNCTDDYVYLLGSKEINLTDFNIHPPEKFQGMVKVDNSVLINFGIVFGIQDKFKFTSLESKY